MSQSVTVNGTTYAFPSNLETGWGTVATNWAAAVSNSTLQKTGGSFVLTNEVDFGGTYGLKAAYLKTQTANRASTGVVRLARTDLICWRDTTNASDHALGVDTSDRLTFNGNPFLPPAALTASRALVSDSAGVVAVSTVTSTELGYMSGVTSSIQTQLGTKLTASSTDTLTNKTISGSANTITNVPLASAVTGQLPKVNGGTGADNSSVTFPASGVIVTEAGTETLTNKTISGSSNTITNVSLTSGVTGTLPTANGGTGVTSVTTAPAASSFAGWDGNKNLSANNFLEGYATTATAAGTTTLTVSSAYLQFFTGTTTQTLVLPVASTLVNGQSFQVVNLSTGLVTVNTSGGNTLSSLATTGAVIITCVNTSGGTGTASWSATAIGNNTFSGNLPTSQITGTTTNNSAAAGFLGEYSETVIGSINIAFGNGSWGDMASFSLTAGDWEVTGCAEFTLGTAVSWNSVQMGVSTTSGNSATGLVSGSNRFYSLPPNSNYNVSIVVPGYRLLLSTTTTVYLKSNCAYASGTPSAQGARISARRMR